MKTYITCIIASLLTCPLFSQSAFLDAVELSKYIKDSPFQGTVAQFDPAKANDVVNKAIPILLKYTSDPANIADVPDLNDAYAGNPFIGPDNGTSKVLLPNVFLTFFPAHVAGP